MAYTYLVRCSDNSLYGGWTTNLEKRLAAHNSGKGSKYTRSRLPVVLVWYRYSESKITAQKLEYAVKNLTKKQKELLIKNPELIESFCSDILEAENEK
jgi:putative endonuclease